MRHMLLSHYLKSTNESLNYLPKATQLPCGVGKVLIRAGLQLTGFHAASCCLVPLHFSGFKFAHKALAETPFPSFNK